MREIPYLSHQLAVTRTEMRLSALVEEFRIKQYSVV